MKIPELIEDEPSRPLGRIITFYSYKGGTGRSMALANVAWILASNGYRVLAIDWDLEAPGLHRYIRPFLQDPELSDTPGLIDFFVHFTEAARIQARTQEETSPSERPWFYDRADLLRYSVSVDYEFPGNGVLDFVGAGQQGPSYALRVNSFQWNEFYEKLGGGTFLEAMKLQLREQYDYILIDSRTGLSDTSGICTVQMPDELVVCFTLNRQSIFGAASTARSADSQRRLSTGEQGLRIWPVPTRVELHEKDRLEAARLVAKEQFAPFLWHVPSGRRAEYWGGIEVLYFPYYAYEEVLATIADTPRQTASLLDSMERLTARLTGSTVTAMPKFPHGVREQLLARYQPARASLHPQTKRFFVSYSSADESTPTVERIAAALDQQFGPQSAFWSDRIPLGANWIQSLEAGLNAAQVVIVVVGPKWKASKGSLQEVREAITQGKSVVPILINNAAVDDLPPELSVRRAAKLGAQTFEDDLKRFVSQLEQSLPVVPTQAEADIDDPRKGQFGGLSERSGRRLTAQVSEWRNGWFKIDLTVESTDGVSLEGSVEFHLHPTFRPTLVRVDSRDGRACLNIRSWGAFTVGATVDGGLTRLELNLAELTGAPAVFRER